LSNRLHACFLQGVTQGYLRYLRIQGIGYRAALQEQTLTFKLGYSHDITYTLPASLRAFLPEPTLVGIYGIDKTQVQHPPPLRTPPLRTSPDTHAGRYIGINKTLV